MRKEEFQTELETIIGGYIKAQSLELVEVKFHYEGKSAFLRILVDRPEGGISLGECAQLNTAIGNLLDEKNIIDHRYILEVSSPGLDRPLKTKNDFIRCIGKKVKFFLNEPISGKIEWDGVVKEVKDDCIIIDTAKGIIEAGFTKVVKGKQLI